MYKTGKNSHFHGVEGDRHKQQKYVNYIGCWNVKSSLKREVKGDWARVCLQILSKENQIGPTYCTA